MKLLKSFIFSSQKAASLPKCFQSYISRMLISFFVANFGGKINLFKLSEHCGNNSIIRFCRNGNPAAFAWPDAINVIFFIADKAHQVYGFISGKILFNVVIFKDGFINEINASLSEEIQ